MLRVRAMVVFERGVQGGTRWREGRGVVRPSPMTGGPMAPPIPHAALAVGVGQEQPREGGGHHLLLVGMDPGI